jgi:FAD/FMN-containing dehydrogenase
MARAQVCVPQTIGTTDLEALRGVLQGSLLIRGTPGHAEASALYNLRFPSRPLIVVRASSESDVSQALQAAVRHHIPWAVKSGGHSYIGASTSPGMLIDLSGLDMVAPSGASLYRIGSGARLKHVYASLACDGWAVPAGTCDTVGFGGLALGGGVGYLMRQHGLTIDRIRSMRVVLADGRVVTASAASEPDLFWALRGAGGGNFGIVTSFEVDPVPMPMLQQLSWRWSWSEGEAAFARWQHVLLQDLLPRHAVAYISFAVASGAVAPTISGGVISSAGFADLRAAADLFVGPQGVAPLGSQGWWMLPQPVCGEREISAASRYKAKSAMLYGAVRADGIRAIQQNLAARIGRPDLPADNQASVTFLSLGGAVRDTASDETAFVHRQAFADAQYLAYWPGSQIAVGEANLQWMRDIYAASFPILSEGGAGCYVNYCDEELPTTTWPSLYYGANLARLRQVKATYDPLDVFAGSQSIRGAG